MQINVGIPDVSNVKSRLDSSNPNYRPPTSDKKIESRKLVWVAQTKLDTNNYDYRKKLLGAVSCEDGLNRIHKVMAE